MRIICWEVRISEIICHSATLSARKETSKLTAVGDKGKQLTLSPFSLVWTLSNVHSGTITTGEGEGRQIHKTCDQRLDVFHTSSFDHFQSMAQHNVCTMTLKSVSHYWWFVGFWTKGTSRATVENSLSGLFSTRWVFKGTIRMFGNTLFAA